ncbi:MAG: DUF72 domain-containing protein [Gammaproteobacteria bacterium]
MAHGSVRIGISGWRYEPWRGKFYPDGLPQRRELEYASRQLNTIELNGSFYSLQQPESYGEWYEQTPEDFVFAVKGSRYITHMKRLGDIEKPLANFFASGVLRLQEKLGPFLWQFPPNLSLDLDRFENFFKLLPRDTESAVKLAKGHDDKVKGRSWARTDADRPIRHAVEIRNKSFKDERFISLLRTHDVALVVADTAGKWPYMEDVTADFIYARLHGDEKIYVSGYTDEALDDWAEKIRAWTSGKDAPKADVFKAARKRQSRDVYVYFDNDVKVRAPVDARSLLDRLGVEIPPVPAERWEKAKRAKA